MDHGAWFALEYTTKIVDHYDLVLRAKAGDPKAFETLYTECYSPVYRFVLTRTKSQDDAEDITQEVFVKLLDSLKRYAQKGPSLLPYLFVIARNKVIDHYRKKRPEYDDEMLWEMASEDPSPEDVARLGEETAHAVRLLNALGETEAMVVRLKYFDNFSTARIAQMLGKSEDAVRQILSRSIRYMRSLYTSHGSP